MIRAFYLEAIFMDIALIGYGKMGKEIEKAALDRGHRIGVRIDPAGGDKVAPEFTPAAVSGMEVAIEFSHPGAALANIRMAVEAKMPLVVGTTGWYSHLAEVQNLVEQNGTGLVYAPNFSLGVNLFYLIVEKAASLFNHFDAYDVALVETHHRHKVDSPSGTAKKIAEILLKNIQRKKRITSESLNRPIAPDELHLVAIRSGEYPGTHTVNFDSLADTIELTHTARSRAGLALGAVLAAEWIDRRRGIFTFDQVLKDILGLA
jgi:4-hydroxy-tetrahydrodipicolinate reductase